MSEGIAEFTPPGVAVLSDYNSPDAEYGGGGPSTYLSADGSRFWGALVKQGGVLRFVVYQTSADGAALLSSWAESGIVGQGAGLVVQPNGVLEAVGYTDYGDGRTMRAVPVPGWKAHATARAWVAAGFKALLSPEAFADWFKRFR